jgi:hypothetical protein
VWSYDFVFDWCANGQQLKCLTITDEWTKEGLAIEIDGRIRSGRVIEVLSLPRTTSGNIDDEVRQGPVPAQNAEILRKPSEYCAAALASLA